MFSTVTAGTATLPETTAAAASLLLNATATLLDYSMLQQHVVFELSGPQQALRQVLVRATIRPCLKVQCPAVLYTCCGVVSPLSVFLQLFSTVPARCPETFLW